MEAAAKNLSGITLELGGKSPVIIDGTGNTRDITEKIAWGKPLIVVRLVLPQIIF